MKRLLFAIALVLSMAAESFGTDEFLISYWHGPKPDQEAFARIAAADFNVAMCGGGKEALELAEAHGLKVMIMDRRIFSANLKAEELEKGLDAVVADYAGHPALWGYYVTDEPNASQFENLGAINRYLLKKDPRHIPFINLFPTYATPQQLGNPTYEEHVASFLSVVRPRILSYDHYALLNDGFRPDYFENMEIIRQQALKHNVPFNYILLSIAHFSYYRDPSEADLRWQVNTALAYGARGIMYFTYSSLPDTEAFRGWGDAIIGRNGQPTVKYEQVKQINGELKRLAPTLMRLTSTGVYHTQPLPRATTAMRPDDLVARIEGGQFVVGHFRSDRDERYLMFVNRSPRDAAEATIVFSGEVTLEQLGRTTGEHQGVALQKVGTGSAWKTGFQPGQGRLVKVN